MAFIETPAESELYGPGGGDVTNYLRLFAHRPAVYQAWQGLAKAIKANMDTRRFELATLAAAQTIHSSYCAIAHGKIIAENWIAPDALIEVVNDRAASLDALDAAVMDFAEHVAADATSITQADVDRLRALGLADAEILDVALAAAVRCFFSKTLDALGVQADAAYRTTVGDELRTALTVGRPVAEA